jgi:hypothetical protein
VDGGGAKWIAKIAIIAKIAEIEKQKTFETRRKGGNGGKLPSSTSLLCHCRSLIFNFWQF